MCACATQPGAGCGVCVCVCVCVQLVRPGRGEPGARHCVCWRAVDHRMRSAAPVRVRACGGRGWWWCARLASRRKFVQVADYSPEANPEAVVGGVGELVGASVGVTVGKEVGTAVGVAVGELVGAAVGVAMGAPESEEFGALV